MQGFNPATENVVPDPGEQALLESGLPLPEARRASTLPPGGGEAVLPHYQTFSSLVNSMSRVYRWTYDEALKHSQQNALAIRRDPVVMDALRSRQIPTAQLQWHIEAEGDDQDELTTEGIRLVTEACKSIPRAQQYLMHCQEALWFGRYGVQEMFEWDYSMRKKQLRVRDHRPLNGDKLIFRWSGEVGILVHSAYKGSWQVTDRGRAHFLTPEEREQVVVHRFEPEDADYSEGELAGGINGVGIRSRIYWLWYLRQQVTAFLMDYLERVGAGGFTIYYYEFGNPESLEQVKVAAEAQWRNNAILFPRYRDKSTGGPGVEVIQVSLAGAQLLQALITDYFDNIIRRYILGQSLTSEAQGTGLGSGVADLHADTFSRLIKYDAVNLQETLTTDLVAVFQKYNCPKVRKKLRWVFEVDKPNAAALVEAAQILYEMGGTIDEDELRGIIGLAKPAPGSSMLAKFQNLSPMAGSNIPQGVPMAGEPGPIGSPEQPVPPGGPQQGGQPIQPQAGTPPLQMARVSSPRVRLARPGVPIKDEIETPERREAREALEAFQAGTISHREFLSKQLPGFRHTHEGKDYVQSFDRGPMVKNYLPVTAYQGSAIGQQKLYSPKMLAHYKKFLVENPTEDTEPIVVLGDETGYSVYDGHHRLQAYKDTKRTHIPAWRAYEEPRPPVDNRFTQKKQG